MHTGVEHPIQTGLARTEPGLLLLAGTGRGAELSGEVVTRAGCQPQGWGLGSGLLAGVSSSALTKDKGV